VYARMKAKEDQAVFGRWRALTHVHYDHIQPGDPKVADVIEKVTDSVVRLLFPVMQASNWKGQVEAFGSLMEQKEWKSRVSVIVQQTIKIRRAIRVEITSGDLEVTCIRGGKLFDSWLMRAIDERAERSSKKEEVLCTNELGLTRRSKDSSGLTQRVIVLRPKVVCASAWQNQPVSEPVVRPKVNSFEGLSETWQLTPQLTPQLSPPANSTRLSRKQPMELPIARPRVNSLEDMVETRQLAPRVNSMQNIQEQALPKKRWGLFSHSF